jgi:nucleoside-diphosphate-sugar epimerase
VDLAEWYAAGRWVALLDLIDMLPSACRLNEAIVNDKEYAAHIAAMPKPDTEWAPRVAEFDLNAHLLREILHALKSLKQATVAVNGVKPGEEKPFPGPKTELDRAIEDANKQWAESFLSQFGFDSSDI